MLVPRHAVTRRRTAQDRPRLMVSTRAQRLTAILVASHSPQHRDVGSRWQAERMAEFVKQDLSNARFEQVDFSAPAGLSTGRQLPGTPLPARHRQRGVAAPPLRRTRPRRPRTARMTYPVSASSASKLSPRRQVSTDADNKLGAATWQTEGSSLKATRPAAYPCRSYPKAPTIRRTPDRRRGGPFLLHR